MEQELPSVLEHHLSSSLVFSAFRVTESQVFCVAFGDRSLSFFLLAIV